MTLQPVAPAAREGEKAVDAREGETKQQEPGAQPEPRGIGHRKVVALEAGEQYFHQARPSLDKNEGSRTPPPPEHSQWGGELSNAAAGTIAAHRWRLQTRAGGQPLEILHGDGVLIEPRDVVHAVSARVPSRFRRRRGVGDGEAAPAHTVQI